MPRGFDVSEELVGEGCRLVALWAVLESSTFAGAGINPAQFGTIDLKSEVGSDKQDKLDY